MASAAELVEAICSIIHVSATVRIRGGPRNYLVRARTSAFKLTLGGDQAAF
jgi:hypothetical protein